MENTEYKIIVPIPPNYIVDKNRFGPLELSWLGWTGGIDQTKVVLAGALILMFLVGMQNIVTWIIGLSFVIVFGYYYMKYAWTHEELVATKLHLYHKIRKFRGLNRYSAIASAEKMLAKLHLYKIKDVLEDGIIDFGDDRYGVLLVCGMNYTDGENLTLNVNRIAEFYDSLHGSLLTKVSTDSSVHYQNNIEKFAIRELEKTNNQKDRALFYSMYEMSIKSKKPIYWGTRVFFGIASKKNEIEFFMQTILPGIVDSLNSAGILPVVLTQMDEILNVYENFMTREPITNNKTPALFGDKAIWNDIRRQNTKDYIIENPDHIVVNGIDYRTCILVGTPGGGVSGFPPKISPVILHKLYRTSASDEHMIRIDCHAYKVDSAEALRKINAAINTLVGNETDVNRMALHNLGIEETGLIALSDSIKKGEQNMFDINYIITVSADSYDKMLAGRSKVQAILNGNNIKNRVPDDRILQIINSTNFLPYYENDISVWLPTYGLSSISPLVTGSHTITSEQGIFFGNEVITNQEIIIELEKVRPAHTLMIASSRSGKTTAMMLTEIRAILAGDAVIYITNKPDNQTDYLAPARYFSDRSQIINLGRQPDGNVTYNINPLEIIYNENTFFDPLTKFYEHVDMVKMFINLITGGDRTDSQMSYIGETLLHLYFKHGIDPEDITTWKKENQPTLIELHEIWEHDFRREESNQDGFKYRTINAVYTRTQKFKNTLSWLSNPTNVRLSEQLTVIDLSEVPKTAKTAMNCLLTAILKLRFDINAKQKTTIIIDEAGVLLEDKELQQEFSHYLKQAGSYGIRVILGSQQLSDLASIGHELQSNIFISEVFGLNILKYVDDVVRFFKFSEKDKQFLLSCSKPGMGCLSVGYPYATTYHIQRTLSELEAQIIFGQQDSHVSFSFVHPALEKLSKEQGVLLSGWINGDTTLLKTDRVAMWISKIISNKQGKVYAYLNKEIIDPDNPERIIIDGSNQNQKHFLSVIQIAAYFAERGYEVTISHTSGADVVVQLRDGPVAFEYQMAGSNDPKRLMEKQERYEKLHGRVFFVGDADSAKEIVRAVGERNVLTTGVQLETKLKDLISEQKVTA